MLDWRHSCEIYCRSVNVLVQLGRRLRVARNERLGISRRELSNLTGVSERFLAQMENGTANPSVAKVAKVASVLGVSLEELFRETDQRCVIALLGIRGAGKSVVGKKLAASLNYRFLELDGAIAEEAGISLAQIFELHGEEYYRALEERVLKRVLNSEEKLVVATGGSIVTHDSTFQLLQQKATTIWLQASPKEHWQRVVGQGDLRPMKDNPDAFTQLENLWERRKPRYEAAHIVISTSGITPEDIAATAAQHFSLT